MHLHRHYSFCSLAVLPFLTLLGSVNAKTDLTGCTRTDISSPAGASYAWIVPGTREVCEFLDCGGGRAPPKLNVAGCAAYTGTQTYSPSFMAGFGATATGDASIGSGVGVGVSAAIGTGAVITAVATPTATTGVEGNSEGDNEDADGTDDDLEDEESANADTSIIAIAAATITPTIDATMTSISNSNQQESTASWSAVQTSTPSTTQASTLPTLLSTAESSTASTADSYASLSSSTSSTGYAVTTESLSISRSWVKTVPTFTRVAADGDIHRAGVTESASATLVVSTGAAGRIDAVGGVGVIGIMLGTLMML